MTAIVIDASVSLSWCFEDENDPISEAALELLHEGDAVVPPLWTMEIVNGLVVAERRKRLRATDSDRFLQLLMALPLRVDGEALASTVLQLARRGKLSAYDAAYLELALRRGLPLATKDRLLASAARAMGVSLFGR